MDSDDARQSEVPPLLPAPRQLSVGAGSFTLEVGATVQSSGASRSAGDQLIAWSMSTLALTHARAGQAGDVELHIDRGASQLDGLGDEAYLVEVGSDSIVITGASYQGLIWGLQTLRQLFSIFDGPLATRSSVRCPQLTIVDAPAFRWRGGHVDVARHFLDIDVLTEFVALWSMHKLNRLHLHLSDDQGWRFPSPAYPRLTSVGGTRSSSPRSHHDPTPDGVVHQGSYSTEELEDLVAHGKRLGVAIVPEIDLPGHAQAAIAAYPELGCTTKAPSVWTQWGISEIVLAPTTATFCFLETLVDELSEVFSSPEIHIGGDECPPVQWLEGEQARAGATQRGLTSPEQIAGYFTTFLREALAAKGRTTIVWDEAAASAAPSENLVVMAWRGRKIGRTLARDGYRVILTPMVPLYFDHYQGDPATEPLAIGGLTTLEDVLSYDPLFGIDAEVVDRIEGMQFQLWSEYLTNRTDVLYMAFPRACAAAEVAWFAAPRPPGEFLSRLRPHLGRLEGLGVLGRPLREI